MLSAAECIHRFDEAMEHYPEAGDQLDFFADNLRNSQLEMLEVYSRLGSTSAKDTFVELFYREPGNPERFKEATDPTHLTELGARLAYVRFCMGYAGSAIRGKKVDVIDVAAMAFAYDAYVKMDNQPLFTAVLDSFINKIKLKSAWLPITPGDFAPAELRLHGLALEIAEALIALFRHRYAASNSHLSAGPGAAPPWNKSFRAKLDDIIRI